MVGVTEHVGGCGRVAEELRRAVVEGSLDTVVRLIGLGASVEAVDDGGFTLLQRASCEGQTEIVNFLIRNGANVNAQDAQHGNTPLHEASWKGFSQTAELLVKANANLYLRNVGGFAPLHLACQNGHNQSCRVLLLAGCKPDIKNNYGDTPIHTAARYGHAGVTRILLSARAHVKEVNKNGDTALHIAAAMGKRKLTRMLLEAGADQSTKNKQGETPSDIAVRKDFSQILDILRNPPPIVTPEERLRQEQEQKRLESRKKEETERARKDKRRDKLNDSGTSSKESGTKPKDKKKLKGDSKIDPKTRASRLNNWGVEWSPYGCHVAPPTQTKIASAKLKTLPLDPLSSGEQYYVDLGGNIRKGPVGVGSQCFCAPLFQTVQNKMERDKIDLMDHIDAAHGKLGDRITSLETKTRGQIEKLGDKMHKKIAEESDGCKQRTKWLQEAQENSVSSKMAEMRSWVESRLSYHHPDSPQSIRGKTFIGRGHSFRNIEYPLLRSRSEEAISEVIKTEEDEEPLYKGLRVLDYPTSMYNIPRRVEEDSVNESFISNSYKVNHCPDTRLSDVSYRNGTDHHLQNLLKVSEPEESSTNECSTQKSSAMSDLQDDIAPNVKFKRGISNTAQIYPHESYVPQELNQAVGNLHVYESEQNGQYECGEFGDKYDRYDLRQYNNREQLNPYKAEAAPGSVITEDTRHGFRTRNPYMFCLREGDQCYPRASTENYSNCDKNGHSVYPLHPHDKSQRHHLYANEAINEEEASTYLDMDRYRIQAAVRKLYNGYISDGLIDQPKPGRTTLETSTEHDSHNDSGYSTRLCTASQGPSPALPGTLPHYSGAESNGRVGAHDRVGTDYHLTRQNGIYNVNREGGGALRKIPEVTTARPAPKSMLDVRNGAPGLVEARTSHHVSNGDLLGESSLV